MELQIMIGHVLREHRLAQGKTLRNVGDAAHVSYSYLSEVERGLKPISSEAIWSLSQALEVPISALLAEVSDLMEALEKGELFARAG
jgi:transcriptional regulator with XRE-family HTH domain